MKIPKYKVKKLISESLKKIIIENKKAEAFEKNGKTVIGGVIVQQILYMQCDDISKKMKENSIDLENEIIKSMVSDNLKPKLDYGIDFCKASKLSKLIGMLLDQTNPRPQASERENLIFNLFENVGNTVLKIVGKTNEEMALYIDRTARYGDFQEEGWKEIFDKINNKEAQQQIYDSLN